MRLIAAFLIAPLMASFAMLVASTFYNNTGGLWLFSFVTITSYVITIIVGIPIYFFLKNKNMNSLISYLVVSGAISILPIGYFILFPALNVVSTQLFKLGILSQLVQIFLILLSCFLTTICFWLIARPDKVK
jgi:hypothetical protein